MIIKKVTIENYLCYYGMKEFDLSPGLNIILGENGEGKTKFFEAIDWLLNGDNNKLELLVSAKKLSETSKNETFRVRVSLKVEQYGEIKVLAKSFLVKKFEDGECSVSNYMLEGTEENKAGERSQVDGYALLERIFPNQIRRYSLFKGEAELDIFKNTDALSNLINSFSSAKHFEKYSEKGSFLLDKAEKAVADATRSDNKNQQEYKRLEMEIFKLGNEKSRIQILKDSLEEQIKKTDGFIRDADKYVSNAESLETINARIKNIEDQIKNTAIRIDENYTTSLFDENWILVNFENIHHEYSNKISQLSTAKREIQSNFDKEIGIIEGKALLKAELLNNSIPLPVGVPSKAHMEEMLRDEICKVCNRPAKKGSDEYNFMFKRLEEYLINQEPTKTEGKTNRVFYKNNYIDRLFNLSVSHEDNLANLRGVRDNIKDIFEFNSQRKLDIEGFNEKLESELKEREKIIGSSSIGADKLSDVLKNYRGWHIYLKHSNRDFADYVMRLEKINGELNVIMEKKESLDISTANTFLIKTRNILRDIEKIFKDTKDRKFDEFIELLQQKSNQIFERINIESFTGTIIFKKELYGGKININIKLEEDGGTYYEPSQSLLTSMHISILFAISELTSELKEESYPMIFDAPTSSFGETKSAEFLNLIFKIGNQKILLVKDFLVIDVKSKELSVKKEFNSIKRDKAFWIKLERPFDKKVLKSLNTQIIPL